MKKFKMMGFQYKSTGDVSYLKFMGKILYCRIASAFCVFGVWVEAVNNGDN